MRRFLHWLTAHLGSPRVILDRHGLSPYLSRWYLLGAPRMPDGSHPFDALGSPRPGALWSRYGVCLHCFHRGDSEQELHCHPWRWALSLILSGGYVEERRGKDDVVRRRRVSPGRLNFIRSTDFHRVDLLTTEAWSLFVTGPKFTGWGFWDRTTRIFTPWRQFIEEKREVAP